jgi:hypothetical protein
MSLNPLAAELAAIDAEIAAHREASSGLGYADAWSRVSLARPDLIIAYNTAASRVFVGQDLKAR